MTIKNVDDVRHLLEDTPEGTFMISCSEIKEIIKTVEKSGGSLSAKLRVVQILTDVVHRTG